MPLRPLKQADDAVLLDTSELDFEQSLDAMKTDHRSQGLNKNDKMVLYYIFAARWRGSCSTSASASM